MKLSLHSYNYKAIHTKRTSHLTLPCSWIEGLHLCTLGWVLWNNGVGYLGLEGLVACHRPSESGLAKLVENKLVVAIGHLHASVKRWALKNEWVLVVSEAFKPEQCCCLNVNSDLVQLVQYKKIIKHFQNHGTSQRNMEGSRLQ